MSKPDFTPGAANAGQGGSPYDLMLKLVALADELYAGLGDGADLSTRLAELAALADAGILYINGGTLGVRSMGDSTDVEWTNADGGAGDPTPALKSNGVSAGTYTLPSVTVDATGRVTSISSGTTSSGGEANTVASLGAGESLYAAKDGAELQFKSLVAGAGIDLTSTSQTVTVGVSSGGDVTSVHGRTGAVVAVAGDYSADEVTFAATGGIVATDVQAAIAELDAEKLALTGGTVTGALTVTGNLTVQGTTFTVDAGTVTIADNVVVINEGEVGAGVTAGTSGLEVERGSETNFQVIWDESDDTFRMGLVGSLQAIATREDAPVADAVAFWNDTASRFDTLTGFTWDGTTLTVPGSVRVTAGAPVNQQTGTTYTLVLTDAGKVVECSNASAIAMTVPPNASVAFPVGSIVTLEQTGAGIVTITPGAGVTVNHVDAHTTIKGQYGVVSLRKTATDTWTLYGATAE